MTGIVSAQDRVISLGEGLPPIPERLLLAHARGDVLFICGAGVSMPAGLPDFRQLVLDVYARLDPAAHASLPCSPGDVCTWRPSSGSTLTDGQKAEIERFIKGDYDVVLGMLERRLDGVTSENSQIRQTVVDILREKNTKPAPIHRALMRLADRGGASSIITTNFDRLLESAIKSNSVSKQVYSLGSIPRPTRRPDFAGIFHIHGVLGKSVNRASELVLTDQDFGEFYLRRRVIPDFIYDAARLFHLVLVGYSANDPPMRYLLNSVAADSQWS